VRKVLVEAVRRKFKTLKEKKLIYKQTRRLVSKETVVLRQWGSETQNFGFIN